MKKQINTNLVLNVALIGGLLIGAYALFKPLKALTPSEGQVASAAGGAPTWCYSLPFAILFKQ